MAAAHLMEEEDDLLGAADGEGGDDDAAAAGGGAVDGVAEFIEDDFVVLVEASAVGGFEDEVVGFGGGFGVADDGEVGAADVAGEEEAEVFAFGFEVEQDAGGAEEVAGVGEFEVDLMGELGGGVVAGGAEVSEDAFGVGDGVEGFGGGVAVVLEDGAAALSAFIEKLRVFLLQVSRIEKHAFAEIESGGGGVDVAGVAVASEGGEVAAVVDVGVGEDDAGEGFDRHGEVAVALVGIGAAALVEAAIEEVALTVDGELMHGAGDGLSRPPEGELHAIQCSGADVGSVMQAVCEASNLGLHE